MPIHTYQCEYCGHVFEELIRRDSDEDELVCPKCGATRPRRQMSVTARVGSSAGGLGSFGSGGGSCSSGGG